MSLSSRYCADESSAACRLVEAGRLESPAGGPCSLMVCRQFQDSQVHTFSSVF